MEIELYGWPTYFDNQGHLLDEYKLRKTSFFHGLSDNIRSEAWPFLLSLWDRDSTSLNRHGTRERLCHQYEHLRNGWINAQPELFDREMKQSIKTIGKDVRRTERQHPYFAEEDSEGLRMLRRVLITLSVYDAELAYVQGMNEIVAPILLTLQEESLTFWCFVKLLPMLRDRLLTLDISPQLSSTADLVQYFDQEVYHHVENLTGGHWLFCFRWFLLMFKNEFSMSDILRLWDVLFSQHNTAHFEIFVATSIILMHKEQVLACGTSDQLLHFAQSVTAKLQIDVVINYSRDLSVKIAGTEGLSDNLAALVKQVDKVPPPLVGFVRRRQCFKNVYSGRQNMNDDLIRALLVGNTGNAAQTTPLFFNCTEPPIPVPSQNYLSGIQGVQPLALAVTPQLAPPPTDPHATVAPVGISPLKSRLRRPDALYNDSISANLANNPPGDSAELTHSSCTVYQEYAGEQYSYNTEDSGRYNTTEHNTGAYTQQYGDYYNSSQGYSNSSQGYSNSSQGYSNIGYCNQDYSYNMPQHSGEHYHQGPVQQAYNKQGYDQGPYDPAQYHSYNQHYTAANLPANVTSARTQHDNNPIEKEEQANTHLLTKSEDKARAENSEEEQEDALSKVNDDFWDMRISLHTHDALS